MNLFLAYDMELGFLGCRYQTSIGANNPFASMVSETSEKDIGETVKSSPFKRLQFHHVSASRHPQPSLIRMYHEEKKN